MFPVSLQRYSTEEKHLREWMKVSEGDFSLMYFSGQSTRCCLNTITDTFSQNVTDVLAYLPNGKSFLVLHEFVFAVSQLCTYRSPSPATWLMKRILGERERKAPFTRFEV